MKGKGAACAERLYNSLCTRERERERESKSARERVSETERET